MEPRPCPRFCQTAIPTNKGRRKSRWCSCPGTVTRVCFGLASKTSGGPVGQKGEPMNRILLALTILGVGAGGFLTARNLTTQLAHEANANHESWLVQTQQLAAFQREQADLAVRLRGLKESLAKS